MGWRDEGGSQSSMVWKQLSATARGIADFPEDSRGADWDLGLLQTLPRPQASAHLFLNLFLLEWVGSDDL